MSDRSERNRSNNSWGSTTIILNMASLGVVKKNAIVEVESLEQLLGKSLDEDTAGGGASGNGSGEEYERKRSEMASILKQALKEPGMGGAHKFANALHCPISPITDRTMAATKNHQSESTSCIVSYQGKLLRISRPAISYTKLIRLALSKCTRGRMVLGEIYDFITSHFPYYRFAGSGWKVIY